MKLMSKLRDMKKRFLPLSMLLITMVLAQASFVANAAGDHGKYTPRSGSEATFSSFMKSIRANQETGLIDPALLLAAQKTVNSSAKDGDFDWTPAGPDNFGGMTRAILYTDKSVLIGTMGGDIYETTNGGVTFQRITNLTVPISCMVKTSTGDIFIGTGDGRDAQTNNGLSDLNYETSFIGKGLYKMNADGVNKVAGTDPQQNDKWSFINEMTVANGKIYVATASAIMVSDDETGESWKVEKTGAFRSIRSNNNGDVLAADEKDVYLSKAGADFEKLTGNALDGSNSAPKIIAMSKTDPNYMYVAYIAGSSGSYKDGNMYFTNDNGTTWDVALSSSTQYTMFGTDANYEGVMEVCPDNPHKVLVGSDNLWVVEDKDLQGHNSYVPTRISENNTYEFTAVAVNRYIYLHQGIQNIVFNPKNQYEFYVGTNGGIFKGSYSTYDKVYSYVGGNRYFLTDDEHVSPTRMMSVGVGGTDQILAGCLDHGTILLKRNPMVDNITTGTAIFPNPDLQSNANQQFGFFTKNYAGGPCAISTVDPNCIIVTGTGKLSTPIHRSYELGANYDADNFTGVENKDVFKTPLAFYENYNDPHSQVEIRSIEFVFDTTYIPNDSLLPIDTMLHIVDTVYVIDSLFPNDTLFINIIDTTIHVVDTMVVFHDSIMDVDTTFIPHTTIYDFDTLFLAVRDIKHVGDSAFYYSTQRDYPIDYIMPALPDSLHNDAHLINGEYVWIPNDTIRNLHNPISTTLLVGVKNTVYITRDAILFDKVANWLKLATITGTPSAVALSGDGDVALVGTTAGKLYKFEHISDIFRAEQVDKNDTLNYIYKGITDFQIHEFKNGTATRAITSISFDQSDNKHFIVTLGNYGTNYEYVYKTTDGGANFTNIQGNLPVAPVYSSIIEVESGKYMLGTENGIYVYNGSSWEPSGDVKSPIMDLKQAVVPNHPDKDIVLYDEVGNATHIIYPGVHNYGNIYAATYGSGIIMVGSSDAQSGDDDDDDDMNDGSVARLNVYPNPVKDYAQINIDIDEESSVSYVIYDLSGRIVDENVIGTYGKGKHTLNINTESLDNGSYIINVKAGDKSETAKFLVY